jgi:hypothetical protein
LSKKRKKPTKVLSAAITVPAVLTASAAGATSAVLNFVQQTTQNAVASVSEGLTSSRAPSVRDALSRANSFRDALPKLTGPISLASGGEYFFGPSWNSYAAQSMASAEMMATNVVDIAQQLANVPLSPGDKHHYIQWVLAGNIEPTQAADILAGDDNEKAKAGLKHLVKLIKAGPAWPHLGASPSQSINRGAY